MGYNVLAYQVFSWLLFKLDLASKMYCKIGGPGSPGPQKCGCRVNGRPGIAKQLAFSKSGTHSDLGTPGVPEWNLILRHNFGGSFL